MVKKIIFINNLSEVPRIAGFIDSVGEEAELDMKTLASIQLAIEELTVNVIKYAYPDGHEGKATLEATIGDDNIVFVLKDQGTAFDPTAKADPDLELDPMARPIGGLGIFLARKIMNEVTYQRNGDTNELTMKKITK